MAIPVAVTELVGTFMETLAYGVYIVVFPRCINILRKRNIGRGLMSYLTATMFLTNMDRPGSPTRYFANVDTHLNITKNASYVSTTLLSDALLVYRTFVVWGRNYWITVAPIILLCVDTAMSAWFTWSVNQASPGSSVLVSTVFARSKYFFAVTLAVNLLCTFLIAFRIWTIQRSVTDYAVGSTGKYIVLSAILESAAIYTALLFCLIGTSVTGNSAMFFFLNSMPPMIGSVFSYIVIRSSMDNKHFDSISRTGASSYLGRFRAKPNSVTVDTMHEVSGGVLVHLEQVVQHDTEPESEPNNSHKDDKSFV